LKGPPKWGFLGEGQKYLVGIPQECSDHRSTSFGEKRGDVLNTLVHMHGKEITKKS